MCVAFAVFFEAINMAPFSFEGVDAVNREKFDRGEILKLSRNVSKIADLQAL